MTPREGEACAICGYPVPRPDEPICEQCSEWQTVAARAEQAIEGSPDVTERRAA